MPIVRAWIPTALMRTALVTTALVAMACVMAAPAALADTSSSSNWAGYAVHRGGVSFEKVSGSWRQPDVSCLGGEQTYSAFWVGIGGYSASSPALEQIGTEADCNGFGQVELSAWYELVPAPSTPIAFTLSPGDLIQASVTVNGHRVTVSLYDATSRRAFTRTLSAQTVDTSSAEWIVEAPSDCDAAYSCETLPLANFGATTFLGAKARSSNGHIGSIASSAWGSTKIDLLPSGHGFVAQEASGPPAGSATTAHLGAGGSSFKVSYAPASAGSNPFMSVRSADPVPLGQLVHPTR